MAYSRNRGFEALAVAGACPYRGRRRLEWAEEILERTPRAFHTANRLRVQPSTGGRELEVAMRRAEDGIPVSAAHGCVLSTKRRQVLLRHRPRSISRREHGDRP